MAGDGVDGSRKWGHRLDRIVHDGIISPKGLFVSLAGGSSQAQTGQPGLFVCLAQSQCLSRTGFKAAWARPRETKLDLFFTARRVRALPWTDVVTSVSLNFSSSSSPHRNEAAMFRLSPFTAKLGGATPGHIPNVDETKDSRCFDVPCSSPPRSPPPCCSKSGPASAAAA